MKVCGCGNWKLAGKSLLSKLFFHFFCIRKNLRKFMWSNLLAWQELELPKKKIPSFIHEIWKLICAHLNICSTFNFFVWTNRGISLTIVYFIANFMVKFWNATEGIKIFFEVGPGWPFNQAAVGQKGGKKWAWLKMPSNK
jgi:hypothetical protein